MMIFSNVTVFENNTVFFSFRITVIIGAMWKEFIIHPLLLVTVLDSGREFIFISSFFPPLFLTPLPFSVSKASNFGGLNKIRCYFDVAERL